MYDDVALIKIFFFGILIGLSVGWALACWVDDRASKGDRRKNNRRGRMERWADERMNK